MESNHNDTTQWLLSLLAVAVAAGLAIVRVYAIPEHPTALQHLLSDLIPEAIVALLAVPVVYYMLYKRGISAEHRLLEVVERRLSEAIARPQDPSVEGATSERAWESVLAPFRRRFFHYHLTNDVDGGELWLCKVLDFRNSGSSSGRLRTLVTVQRKAGELHQYTFYASLILGQHLMLVAERADKDNRPAIEIYPFWAPQTDIHCSMRANVAWSDRKLLSIGLLSEKKLGNSDEGPVLDRLERDQLRLLWSERMKDFKVFIPPA